MTRERLQRLFLLWGRPFAPVAALAVYAGVEVAAPSGRARHMIELLALSIVLAVAYRVAALRLPSAQVLRVALALDTVVIALLTVATQRPGAVAVAYFWSIALGAWLLGPAETLAYAALASIGAIVAPPLAGRPQDVFVTVTVVLVLLLIGSLVAVLSGSARRVEGELERQREIESAVAAVLEQTRAMLPPQELIGVTLAALGRECGASRAILRKTDGTYYLWDPAGGTRIAHDAVSAASRHVLATGEPYHVRDVAEADPDVAAYMNSFGARRLVGHPLLWQGEAIGIVGLHDDVGGPWTGGVDTVVGRVAPHFAAALVQAEAFERLREVSRMREELIANVSHELRTPLTSTIGFLQTLERPDLRLSEEERGELIAIARREAERLALLVGDLLQLATLDRGGLKLEAELVEVEPLVRDAIRAAIEDDRPVEVEVEPVTVRADPVRILQVLRNLVQNACRHGAGTIRVRGARTDRGVRIAISDEGPGVAPEHVPDLFVPFAHWSGRNDSSGLGLAIARRIAEAHGGRLEYHPRDDGEPHAFVLELPV